MIKRLNSVVLIIFALVISSLACNFGFGRPATLEIEDPAVAGQPISPGSIQPVPETGTVVQDMAPIVVTEGQLQALMENELQQRIGDQIEDLRVYLRTGNIQVEGKVNTQGVSAPVKVVIDVSVDLVGRPSLSILSANIGPFPVPGDLVTEVETMINKAFMEKVVSLAPNMHIDNIVIQNGVMTIYGHSEY